MEKNPATSSIESGCDDRISQIRTGYETSESFHRMTDIIKCKWTLAVIREISEGTARPSAIMERLPGLTSKVLTDRLKMLESFGLLHRESFAEIPPRVEYTLTDRGQELVVILGSLIEFIDRWES